MINPEKCESLNFYSVDFFLFFPKESLCTFPSNDDKHVMCSASAL